MLIVLDVIQMILVVIGVVFMIKGIVTLAKYYNIDKFIYFCIKKEFLNINEEKRK